MRRSLIAVLTTGALGATCAHADYASHSWLAPKTRCETIGVDHPDCQKLLWDLEPALRPGERAVAAPDPATGYPRGRTDRPPPLYVADTDDDGEIDSGFEEFAPGRVRLCLDEDEIPWWKPTGDLETVGGRAYPVFEVACRRGTRIHYGPWQTGTDPNTYDQIARAIVRFENSERLDSDGRPPDDRREWNTGVEFFNHFASHHGTCRNPAAPYDDGCNDPNDPARASSPDCDEYQARYDECPMTSPTTGECTAYQDFAVQARAATQFAGRFAFHYPEGRALVALEDQLWTCNHHVVTQLYLNGKTRNYRNQAGGAVGEMVIQLFTERFDDPEIEPLSFLGAGLLPVLTTFVPPFTMSTSSGVWYAPYDLELAMLAIHAHKRLVKTWVDVVPANPPRLQSGNPDCGGWGSGPAENLYVGWDWSDGAPCNYFEEPDGPVILRKGQALRWHCVVNNGITPDYLHQQAGDEGDLVAANLYGIPRSREAIWGRQDPETYRVRYGCESREGVPPGTPPIFPATVCEPNPATDDEGRPIDGPYENPEQCRSGTGRCVPANVVFANVAEDEMCLVFGLYWPLDRPVDADLNAAREGELAEVLILRPDDLAARASDPEEAQKIGTPGALLKQIDDGGVCQGCTKTGIQRIDSAPSDEENATRFP